MANWEPRKPLEAIPHVIDNRQYETELAEISGLLYSLFCQTDRKNRSKSTGSGLQTKKEFRQ